MRTTRTALFVLSTFFVCASVIQAEDSTALADRLHRAQALNSLDDPSLKPWHLKLSFQLFDSKGKPSDQGTIEEWWRSPSSHKTIYTSPSYSATEVQTSEAIFRTKGAPPPPYLLTLVLKEIVHPLADEDIAESTPDLRQVDLSKVPFDCIMLSQPIRDVSRPPLGLFPTYCFDRGLDSLRVSYNFGSQLTIRNKMGIFQQRNVPVDQTVQLNSIDVISAHVEILRGESLPDAEFTPSTDLEKRVAYTRVASGVMQGLVLSKPNPIYPETAKRNRVSGTVVIKAVIGSDGRIHQMKLVQVPDPDLAIAAVAAVRQWTYKPYTLNGVPVDVETQITVNFNIGPSSTFTLGR